LEVGVCYEFVEEGESWFYELGCANGEGGLEDREELVDGGRWEGNVDIAAWFAEVFLGEKFCDGISGLNGE
jgi:hypothetical protein